MVRARGAWKLLNLSRSPERKRGHNCPMDQQLEKNGGSDNVSAVVPRHSAASMSITLPLAALSLASASEAYSLE